MVRMFKPLSITRGRRLWLLSGGSYSNKSVLLCLMSNLILPILPSTINQLDFLGHCEHNVPRWLRWVELYFRISTIDIRSARANRFVGIISQTSSYVCEAIKLQDLHMLKPKDVQLSPENQECLLFLNICVQKTMSFVMSLSHFNYRQGGSDLRPPLVTTLQPVLRKDKCNGFLPGFNMRSFFLFFLFIFKISCNPKYVFCCFST